MRFLVLIVILMSCAWANAQASSSHILTWAQYQNLSSSDQVSYFSKLKKIWLSAETYDKKKNNRAYAVHWFNLLFPVAHAANSGQISCVYAGHMSYLVKKGQRTVCDRPKSEICSESEVECNSVIFGPKICVKAGGYATRDCVNKAKPINEIAESLDKSGWKKLSEINNYCKQPLGFQQVICDKFYKHKINQLSKLSPCSDLKKNCQKGSLDQELIAICDLQAKMKKRSPSGEKSGPIKSEKCSKPDPSKVDLKKCLWEALKSGFLSATFLDEVIELATESNLQFGNEGGQIKSYKFTGQMSRNNKKRRASIKRANKKYLEGLFNKMKTDSSYRDSVLEEATSVIQSLNASDEDKSDYDEESLGSNAKKLNESSKKNHFSENDLDEKHLNQYKKNFTDNDKLKSCPIRDPNKKWDVEGCKIVGGLGGDLIGLIVGIVAAPVTGGASTAGSVLKLAKLGKRLFKLIQNPSTGKYIQKFIGADSNVVKLMVESGVDNVESYLADSLMCNFAKVESRCKSVQEINTCVSSGGTNCL